MIGQCGQGEVVWSGAESILTNDNIGSYRATMAELPACSLHDQKVVGLNPAGSNSDRLVSITRTDGYIMFVKYDMEFPDTIKQKFLAFNYF